MIQPALPRACSACPWRLSNQGTPHPHGFYDRENIKRLWAGIRTGEAPGMTCHPTDPRMSEFEGYERTAEADTTYECMGSWTIVAREVARFETICREVDAAKQAGAKFRSGEALRRYRAETKGKGFTRDGLRLWAVRFALAFPGENLIRVPREALLDEGVGTTLAPAWERARVEAVI